MARREKKAARRRPDCRVADGIVRLEMVEQYRAIPGKPTDREIPRHDQYVHRSPSAGSTLILVVGREQRDHEAPAVPAGCTSIERGPWLHSLPDTTLCRTAAVGGPQEGLGLQRRDSSQGAADRQTGRAPQGARSNLVKEPNIMTGRGAARSSILFGGDLAEAVVLRVRVMRLLCQYGSPQQPR